VTFRKSRRRPAASEDDVFAEALAAASGGASASRERQAERKNRQLCRQVQRSLNLALAEGDAGVSDLYVDDVTADGGGPLVVHIAVPAARAVGDALEALRADAPRLRAEVARAITRKRTPELAFVAAVWEDGRDE
jgi:ribosome-binding factor A